MISDQIHRISRLKHRKVGPYFANHQSHDNSENINRTIAEGASTFPLLLTLMNIIK